MGRIITAAIADGALSGNVTPLPRPGSPPSASYKDADEDHLPGYQGAMAPDG